MQEEKYLFKLEELHSLFINRLRCYGIETMKNKTRLKEKILEEFPDATEQTDGKNTIIAFPDGMKRVMRDAMMRQDHSYKAEILSQAAKIVREEALDAKYDKFSGSFEKDCQEAYVPPNLGILVSMLLNGVNISEEFDDSQCNLTIAQLLLFNMRKNRAKQGSRHHHKADQEPPLCTYLGLWIHSLTRSKKLIQKLHYYGICPAYDRIIAIQDDISYAVCEQYIRNGIVAPCWFEDMQEDDILIFAADNVDHNPSSTTSNDSFHGTSLSMFKTGPLSGDNDEKTEKIKLPSSGSVKELPQSYSVVPCVEMQTTGLKAPLRLKSFDTNPAVTVEGVDAENEWLRHSASILEKELVKDDRFGWYRFHASNMVMNVRSSFSQVLLPLFRDKAATVPMLKHTMDIVLSTVNYLNPGQIPVIVGDQPIYALLKTIQWKMPSAYGEDKIVVWPGGLHQEMALWTLLGDILDGIGWDTLISEADIATPGVAKSLLKVSHLMRTRNAHQVTLLSLFILKMEAWNEYRDLPKSTMSYHEWTTKMSSESPTFGYWQLVMDLEKKVLMFVRAQRSKDFFLYIQSLKDLVPYFFALDHGNYARWTSVHIRDLCSLPESIHKAFCRGFWVLSKTKRRFSAIPVDQCHEQNNKLVKGAGGIVGLTDNPGALKRWMTAGPEISRILEEFEDQTCGDFDDDTELLHHQEGLGPQVAFQSQVQHFVAVIKAKGNPFCDHFSELVTLDTRKVLDSSVAESVKSITKVGEENYEKFRKNILEDRISTIDEPIKRNNLPLPKNPRIAAKTSKTNQKVKYLQKNVELFGKLYLSTRESDRDEFFSHEVNAFPASLSDNGLLHFPSNKSDLVHCVIPDADTTPSVPKTFDCSVLDGPAIVHLLSPEKVTTFREYSDKVFIPYIENQLKICDRIDIVFDQYLSNSLKKSVRERRGSGLRFKVEPKVKIPK